MRGLLPSLVSEANAQAATSNVAAFGNAISPIIEHVVSPIVRLAFAVAVVVFVYGVIQMMLNKTDSESHTKGRWAMLGGIIGMFIMVSAWGIIFLISNTVKEF